MSSTTRTKEKGPAPKPQDKRRLGNRFYVTLSPRGRLTGWGQFDPDHPNLQEEVLVSPFAKWAGKQDLGHQRLKSGEHSGDDFWIGDVESLEAAVQECISESEKFEQSKK